MACETSQELAVLKSFQLSWETFWTKEVKFPLCFSLSLLKANLLLWATKCEEFLLFSDTAKQWGWCFHKMVCRNWDCIKWHFTAILTAWLFIFQTFKPTRNRLYLPFNQRMTSGYFDLRDPACPSIMFAAHTHWPQLVLPSVHRRTWAQILLRQWIPSSFSCVSAGAQRNGLRNRRNKILQWTFKLK